MTLNQVKNLNKLLPLVAVGTVADCQSVLDRTNRILVRTGLKMLGQKQSTSKGLLEILKQLGFLEKMRDGYQLTSQELAFYLSPVLNSSGRINHARLSIRALLSNDFKSKNFSLTDQESANCQTLEDFTKNLIVTNQDRKNMVKKILAEVENQAHQQFLNNSNLIWLEGSWSKGIIGLLASRLVNQYDLPVVVIEKDNENKDLEEKVSASLRAPEGFNLPEAMTTAGADLFLKYGGHPGAAGFTALSQNLAKIKQGFNQALKKQKESLSNQKQVYQDKNFDVLISDFIKRDNTPLEKQEGLLNLKYQKNLIHLETQELNQAFLQEMMLLDPFGQDFPFPNLISVFTNYTIRWLGLEQKHARINFASNYFTVFNLSPEFKQKLIRNDNKTGGLEPILAVLKPNQNTFRGSTSLDLIAELVF